MIKDILDFLYNNMGLVIIGSLTLVQVVPLQINPWTTLGHWIQGILGIREMKENQKKFEEEVNAKFYEIQKATDEKQFKKLRADIFDFANSCRNKRKHTYSQFEEVSRWYEEYERYIEKYNFENSFLEDEYAYIRKVCNKCRAENSFLENINRIEEIEELIKKGN